MKHFDKGSTVRRAKDSAPRLTGFCPVCSKPYPDCTCARIATVAGQRMVEPVKRMVGGRYGWAVHRFPIKGGITLSQVWAKDLTAMAGRTPNSLAALLGPAP